MKAYERAHSFYEVFERKGGVELDATHYCPGCGHGIVHKMLAELIDTFKIQERTVLISPVGCSVFAYYYFDVGNVQAAHGRAPAVATGIKRSRPDSIVISYQGDGDLAAIGGNNILQAANRGENITVIFINNAIYGMTGGQLAPTSLIGMKTTTTPDGRAVADYGEPIHVAELLANLPGVSYSTRTSLTSAGNLNKTRKAIEKALRYQIENKGFSIVEILSQCPTGWKMDPVESLDWVEKEMQAVFPLGVFKDAPKERPVPPHPAHYDPEQVRGVLFDHGHAATRQEGSNQPILANWPGAQGRSFREVRLKSAGFGGQGILLLGELLAQAGIATGLHATWLPSYGPEMRGGTANCSVVLSPSAIGNPMVERPNVLIAMNRPSLERFASTLEPGGILLYDASLIDSGSERDDIVQVPVAATKIADELGSAKVANVVMIGALIGLLGLPKREDLETLLSRLGRSDAVREANRLALQRGQEVVGHLAKEVAISG